MAIKRIYLDVCALCRPYDDQGVLRNRIETDALYVIRERVRSGVYSLIVSPVHLIEIGATTHQQEGAEVLAFLDGFAERPSWDMSKARERAEDLYRKRFGPADAAHVAFAEQAADVFITCDDALLKKCRKTKVGVRATGPIEFLASEGLG